MEMVTAGGSKRSMEGSSRDEQPGDEANYETLNLVGTGAYGCVYRARDLRDNHSYVALKKIRMRLTDEGVPLNAVREIAVLRQLDKFEHPNIVRLLDVCLGNYSPTDNETSLTFVFEYMDMDLGQYIRRCPPPGLPHSKVKDFMRQMLRGIEFLHTNKIVHRDLKPQNILLTHKGCLKIADMGLARIYTFSMLLTSTVVTLWYRAPEVLMQDKYGSPIDTWSIGCMFAEMLNKRPLFAAQSEITQLQKIFSIIGLPDESEWPETVSLPRASFPYTPQRSMDEVIHELEGSPGKDLIECLLRFNQYQRITASAALKHAYFEGMLSTSSDDELHQDVASGECSKSSTTINVNSTSSSDHQSARHSEMSTTNGSYKRDRHTARERTGLV